MKLGENNQDSGAGLGDVWYQDCGGVVMGSVLDYRSLLLRGLGLRYLHQVHGSKVYDDQDYFACRQEGDGLVTQRRNLALAVRTADCVPVYLWDQDKVGVIHAGWRGVKSKIYETKIQDFDVSRLSVAIGPSIFAARYEVDADLYKPWLEEWPRLERYLTKHSEHPTKRLLDLRAIVCDQFMDAGVEKARIQRIETCTYDSALPSYRRQGAAAGRLVNYIYRC